MLVRCLTYFCVAHVTKVAVYIHQTTILALLIALKPIFSLLGNIFPQGRLTN